MMNDTLLCQTLKALAPVEHRLLAQALQSPLFNPSRLAPKCIELHRYLFEKGFDHELKHEEAFAFTYPGKPFNRALLDNVMSALMDCIREFIAWRQMRQVAGEAGTRLEMARFYRANNLHHRFEQSIEQVRRQLKKQANSLSIDIHFQYFQVEMEVYDHLSVINDLQNDLNLPAATESFIQYYLAQGLELALRLAHQANLTALDFSHFDAFSESLRSIAKGNSYFHNPLIEQLCLAFELLDVKTPEVVFHRFVALFNQENHRLKFNTLHFLATMARHYCLGKINHGEAYYRPVLLGLYRSHLEMGLLYEKEKILHNTLLNIVNMAVGENEGSWAKEILEAHRFRITGSESQEASYFFIKAFLCFNQNNFGEAGLALEAAFAEINRLESRSHFKDFNLKLMARKLEIQILYENDPTSTLLCDRLNAHKMFVHRNRYLTNSHKTLHNNFVDLMKQLVSPASQTDSKRAKKLLDKLQQPGFLIADRKWVTEKVQLLAAVAMG